MVFMMMFLFFENFGESVLGEKGFSLCLQWIWRMCSVFMKVCVAQLGESLVVWFFLCGKP